MRPLMTTPLLAGRYLVGETLGGGKEAVVSVRAHSGTAGNGFR